MSGQKVPRSVEQRIVIKFLVGENVPSAEIHHRLQQQYGEGGGRLQLLGKRYRNSPTTQQDVLLQKTGILISTSSFDTIFIFVFVPIYGASYSRRLEPQISYSYCWMRQVL